MAKSVITRRRQTKKALRIVEDNSSASESVSAKPIAEARGRIGEADSPRPGAE